MVQFKTQRRTFLIVFLCTLSVVSGFTEWFSVLGRVSTWIKITVQCDDTSKSLCTLTLSMRNPLHNGWWEGGPGSLSHTVRGYMTGMAVSLMAGELCEMVSCQTGGRSKCHFLCRPQVDRAEWGLVVGG